MKAVPVDMFPQTKHIELIMMFERDPVQLTGEKAVILSNTAEGETGQRDESVSEDAGGKAVIQPNKAEGETDQADRSVSQVCHTVEDNDRKEEATVSETEKGEGTEALTFSDDGGEG